jgi:hypothetical protein
MWQWQVIRRWRDLGRLEEKRSSLRTVLQEWFGVEVPPHVAQLIDQTTDLETPSRWLRGSLAAASLDEFRRAVHPPPIGATST